MSRATATPVARRQDRATGIRTRGLRRVYGDAVAVQGLDLDVHEGEFFSLIGPSGCGKTTTLRMLAGLDAPTAGTITIAGRDMTSLPAHKRPVNTVFQQYALFPHLDVFENVRFGLREARVPAQEATSRVTSTLEFVGLSGRERSKPAELSGGQQQRVALARALVLEPDVLLLDEPLGALDLALRKQLQLTLKRIQREVGITFVYVTHDQEEAFSMSDRVGVMHEGALEQVAPPTTIYREPATQFVASFVGSTNRLPATVERVLDANRYAVDLGPAGRAEVRGVAGLGPADEATAIVRPEALRLTADGGRRPALRAEVVDVAYLGPRSVVTLSAPPAFEALTLSATEHDETATLAPGARVEVSWEGAATWLVAA